MNRKALLIVDVQNDFCPGGALAVPRGDEIIPIINQYVRYFEDKERLVFASRDWHPRKTKHFKEFGGSWPAHCVKDTPGADFHPDLDLPDKTIVLPKGTDPESDGYSAFEGVDKNGVDFKSLLTQYKVKELFVCGLATDYCVKNSVLDGIKNFEVFVLKDAIRGVNVNDGDSKQAMAVMAEKGARFIDLNEFKEKYAGD